MAEPALRRGRKVGVKQKAKADKSMAGRQRVLAEKDTTGDGKIDTREIDTTGDGKVDHIWKDTKVREVFDYIDRRSGVILYLEITDRHTKSTCSQFARNISDSLRLLT